MPATGAVPLVGLYAILALFINAGNIKNDVLRIFKYLKGGQMKRNPHNGHKRKNLSGICFAVSLIAFTAVPAFARQATVVLKFHKTIKERTVYAAIEGHRVVSHDR